MSIEADRLAREAEQRRSSLDSTLDALKDRFSAGQIVDEVAAYLRNWQGADMVHNLNRQVRDNPLALGLIGAGAAWLLLGQGGRGSGTGRSAGYDATPYEASAPEAMSDGVRYDGAGHRRIGGRPVRPGEAFADGYRGPSPDDRPGSGGPSMASTVAGAASEVADAVSGAADSVAEGAKRLRHDASDALHQAGDAVQREASEVGERVSRLGRQARRTVLETLQDEPLVLGAVALAIGAAIGAALPSTRVEDELMGETRDRVRDEAIARGSDVLRKAEAVAVKVSETAGAEAQDAGLTPAQGGGETLAETISSVVRSAADEAKDEAKAQGLV